MFRNKPLLEWDVLADDDREKCWPPERSDRLGASGSLAVSQIRRTVLFALSMLVLLTVGIGAVYARNEAQKGIAEVDEGVQAAVDAAVWVQAYAPELTAEMLVDDASSSYVGWMTASEQHLLAAASGQKAPVAQVTVRDTRFAGRHAAVNIDMTLPGAGDGDDAAADLSTDMTYDHVYRQTRFYRETPQGWLRAEPVASLWGKPRSRETEHIEWRYRQRDEDAVLDIAQQLDTLYTALLTDYGLAHDGLTEKLTVDIRVDYLPGRVLLQERLETLIAVPSPAVYLLPQRHSDADVLAQAVALAMLNSLWDQATEVRSMGMSDAVLRGLRFWEMREMGLGLSTSTWNALLRNRGDEDLAEACAAYAVWMLRPVAAGLPVYCAGAQMEPMTYRVDYLGTQSLRNMGLSSPDSYIGFSDSWSVPMGAPVLMAAVVDYAVTAYGRESLPELLAAAAQHDSWETLVPSVYGVSFEEFEQGWREHVADVMQPD